MIKRIGVVVFFMAALFIYSVASKQIPEGRDPQKADELALKVMNSLGKPSWDSTRVVEWDMFGHAYKWYKLQDSVIVKWGKYTAFVNLNSSSGKVLKEGELIQKNEQDKIEKAINYFNNDSFWLCAHYKMMDPGTIRELVDLKEGKTGLKVSYNSGGTTPGDTYLWILENNKPVAWKMWVSIIPFGGVKAKWSDWETTSTGAQIALKHKLLFFNVGINNLKTY